MTEITVGQLIAGAFNLARFQYPEINKRWITASYRMGGLLPDAMLMATLQQAGELDLVCRSMELEMQASVKAQQGGVAFDGFDFRQNLSILSSQWVSLAYAAHYALHSRKLLPAASDNLSAICEFCACRFKT